MLDPIRPALERREDIGSLVQPGSVCIELGVAEGEFAERFLRRNPHVAHLFGVDLYADRGHNTEEYCGTTRRLLPFLGRHSLLRMSFDDALTIFPDGYFDLIYVDGYAHTGQEDGVTLQRWYPKLKPGGIFSGDDYDPKWPKVQQAVNDFAKLHGVQIALAGAGEKGTRWSGYPSWFFRKPGPAQTIAGGAWPAVAPPAARSVPEPSCEVPLSSLAWLFTSDNRNRGLIRQNFDEACMLWRATQATAGDVLEIGRARGGTTVLLAAAAGRSRGVISVEDGQAPEPAVPQFLTRLEPRERPIVLLDQPYDTALSHPDGFGLLCVAGVRSRDGLLRCLSVHWDSLRSFPDRPGSLVIQNAVPNGGLAHEGRPNHFDGVAKLCAELVAAGAVQEVERAGSAIWLHKRTPLPKSLS